MISVYKKKKKKKKDEVRRPRYKAVFKMLDIAQCAESS
jgi:hypothetical protein